MGYNGAKPENCSGKKGVIFMTNETLGKRIVRCRKGLGLTQDALAEQLGVTAQAVSKWENDLSYPDLECMNRLSRIEGQIRGIRGMLERDAYCNDILTQSAAGNAAVNAFNRELIARHLRGCVARDLKAGEDEVIDELVATLQKLMK